MDNSNLGTSSFWKRPEGKAGYALLGLLGAGALTFFYFVGPAIINSLVNVYYIGGLLAGIYAIYTFATSNVAWALFTVASRWMTEFFVELDPVKIMEGFLSFAQKQRDQLVEAVGEVMGAARNLRDTIRRNDQLVQSYHDQAQAGVARSGGVLRDDDLEVNAALENAAAIQNVNKELESLATDLDQGVSDLTEALKRVDYEISRTKTDVSLERQRYKAAQALGSASSKISAVLSGGGKREMYDMAIDRTRTVYAQKRAVLQTLVETSRHAAGSIDLQQRALRNQGLSQLRAQLGGMKGEGFGLLTAGNASVATPRLKATATISDDSLNSFINNK